MESPCFDRDDKEAQRVWARNTRFVGRLSRVRDLKKNRQDLKNSPSRIREAYEEEFRIPVPERASVILPEDTEIDSLVRLRARNGFFFVPVADSDHTLFLHLDLDLERQIDETVEGLLEPFEAQQFYGMAQALKTALPAYVGIITPMSIEDYNALRTRQGGSSMQVGLVLIWTSGLLFFLRYRWYVRERKELDREVGREMEKRRTSLASRWGGMKYR